MIVIVPWRSATGRVGKAGASFRSLGDPLWDTSSAQGRLLSTLLASIAEFERELIRERTGEGRKRAMAAGIKFGRKRKLSDYQRAEAIKPPRCRRNASIYRQELRRPSGDDFAALMPLGFYRSLGRPKIDEALEKRIQAQLRGGKGMRKIARELGVGFTKSA
jgi:hypothetical protein